ncbi:hypothetical protein PT2222_300120 [Paraburkholderia tropica]
MEVVGHGIFLRLIAEITLTARLLRVLTGTRLIGSRSCHIQVDVLVHGHGLEPCRIQRDIENRLLLLRGEAPREVGPELFDQQRDAGFAASLVADRILHHDFVERRAVVQLDGQRIRDRTLVGIVIIARELRIFHADDLRAQGVDARVARDIVFVIGGRQSSEKDRHGHHVLDAMIAVRRIRQRAGFVDNADRRFVRADRNARDVFGALAALNEQGVQRHGRFGGGLCVEFGGKRDLEQHVLHHVRAVGALEREGAALERDVVEAPRFRRERRGIAHFAGLRDQREVHAARGGVAGGPRLARAGVGRVAIGAQRLAVDHRQRHGVDEFVAREPEQLADHGGRGELDEQHMVETDLVERVFQRDAALDFVRLHHAFKHVLHGERRFARGDSRAREPVGGREYAAQVVRRMAPFGGEPGVVEVEPADHGADVEGGLNRVELECGARHLRAVRDDRARHDGPEQLGAGGIGERLESAAEGVQQAVARRRQRGGAVAGQAVQDVVDDIDEDLIRLWPDMGIRRGHRGVPAVLTGPKRRSRPQPERRCGSAR